MKSSRTTIKYLGCVHKWKVKEEIVRTTEHMFSRNTHERIIIVQCKRCGEIMFREIPLGYEFIGTTK